MSGPQRAKALGLSIEQDAMVELTANPAAGVSVEEGRRLCEKLADDVRQELRLLQEYGVSWLGR